MQNLLSIDGHSIIPELLTGGPVLDAGSRGMRFAKWFVERGHRVIALDPGEDEMYGGVEAYKLALTGPGEKERRLILTDDLEARYVVGSDRSGGESYLKVQCVTLEEISNRAGVGRWDVIKLNIEGSEYGILEAIEGPVARQIVFSFHEHTGRARGRFNCDLIIDRLKTWYDVHNQVWEPRYGCQANYWDVLLTERGI